MSVWTVRRQLERLGYTSTLPRGTPMLTQQHKNARVQWAIKHKNDDRCRIIFIDETCYQLFRNTIRRWSLNPSAEVKRIPKNRQKIMVWGGISIKGLIGYHSIRNIMDSPYFVRILQDHLIPNAKNQFGRRWRLQMDNDLKHRSRVAQDFLSRETPEVMENLWAIIERRIEKRKPGNIEELNNFLHEEWNNIDINLLVIW